MITIKQAREESGISIRGIAIKLGVSKNTYVNKEQGKSKFYIDEALLFCKIVNKRMDQILFFEDYVPEKRNKT